MSFSSAWPSQKAFSIRGNAGRPPVVESRGRLDFGILRRNEKLTPVKFLAGEQPERCSLCLPCWSGRGLGYEVASAQYLPDVLWLFCRAQSYAERLRLGLAVIHGEAQCTEQDMDDGRHSPPMVKNATVHPGLELPCKIKLLCLPLGKKNKSLVGNCCWFSCVSITNLMAVGPVEFFSCKGWYQQVVGEDTRESFYLTLSGHAEHQYCCPWLCPLNGVRLTNLW